MPHILTPLEQVRVEQIRSIYRNSVPGNITTLITVFVLTGGLAYIDAATRSQAAVFLSFMLVQGLARLTLMRAYLRGGEKRLNWRPWAFWFTIGAFAGGLTIGVGSIWMVANQKTDLQLIALLLIFAVTGGSVGAFGAYLPAFYAFFTAIAVAPVVWLFAQGDGLHVTIGVLFVLWFLAVAEQARRSSQQFVEFIDLRLENVDLVENLRREKATAEEANVAKSRFLASASHDLRQPVHALSIFVGAMRAHQMNAAARVLLDHIDRSVQSLRGLFEGLLDISRLDAGVIETHRAPFAIQPVIDRVCQDYEPAANKKGVRLRAHRTRAVVNSDPMLCERVLRNIVANAVTYTDRGTVLVGCRRGSSLRLQVWDTGSGIAPDQLQLIFQEFYQVANPERDRTRGVGLGLAIVKRLSTLLNHPLHVKSWPGRGTCFTLELPYASPHASVGSVQPPTVESPVDSSAGSESGLILVVDDEREIQIAMQSLLQSWGYSVIAAGSLEEILERVAERREVPRLIVCDYRLRDNETGRAVIERLRHEYNEDIPGMLITGDTAPGRIAEAQASGYLLLHKPVPNERLREAIAESASATPPPA